MKYTVFIQMDDNEWDYLRKQPNATQWTNVDKVVLFDTIEEAEEECKKWNTGTVVEYIYEH